MTINGAQGPSVDFSLEAPPGASQARTWHEIIPGDLFKASGNHVLVDVIEGSMAVSDIVLLYHSATN
jgi:hypothetical protein